MKLVCHSLLATMHYVCTLVPNDWDLDKESISGEHMR